MWFKIISYLKFLLKSTNHHGVHSPFVFQLITECFYKKTGVEKIELFKSFQNDHYTNSSKIHVTDFGSGSKIFKDNVRKVATIAKVAGISTKRAGLLMRIIAHYSVHNILEIGTSVGLGTAALHLGNPKASVVTLEGCPNTARVAKESFSNHDFKNIKIEIDTFENSLSKIAEDKEFDLIFFDGNHDFKATLNYYETCLKGVHNNTVLIFDDIYWSKGMEKAWNIICKKPEVKVSIDTYQWGLVFFRKEQKKQHFTIRV